MLDELAGPIAAAVAAAGGDGAPVRLDRPADPSHGDYASAVALALAGPLKAPPRQIAERIVEGIDSPWIEGAEIAGPGFINLRLRPAWYGHVLRGCWPRATATAPAPRPSTAGCRWSS